MSQDGTHPDQIHSKRMRLDQTALNDTQTASGASRLAFENHAHLAPSFALNSGLQLTVPGLSSSNDSNEHDLLSDYLMNDNERASASQLADFLAHGNNTTQLASAGTLDNFGQPSGINDGASNLHFTGLDTTAEFDWSSLLQNDSWGTFGSVLTYAHASPPPIGSAKPVTGLDSRPDVEKRLHLQWISRPAMPAKVSLLSTDATSLGNEPFSPLPSNTRYLPGSTYMQLTRFLQSNIEVSRLSPSLPQVTHQN